MTSVYISQFLSNHTPPSLLSFEMEEIVKSFETKCPFSVAIQQHFSFTLWRLDSNESDKLLENHQGYSFVIPLPTTGLHRS